MTITTLASDNAAGVNQARQVDNTTNIVFNDLRLVSSTLSSERNWMAIRFPTTPLDLTKDNLRQVTFQMTGSNNTNKSINGFIHGHAHNNSAAFNNGDGTGNTNIKARLRTTAYTQFLSIPQPPFITFVVSDIGPNSIFEIVKEVISTPGWVGGRPITLIFRPNTDALYAWWAYGDSNDDYKAQLILNYGEKSTDAVELDVYKVGDSTIAYTGQSGFDRGTLTMPLLAGCNFYHAAAGMGPDAGYGGLGAGDNFRGYCEGGIYHRELESRYGDTELVMYSHEHALAGSLAAQWSANIDPGSTFLWGDITKQGTLRYNLANPRSDNQLVLFNLGPNDMLAYAASHLLVDEVNTAANDAGWEDHVETVVEPLVRDVIEEIYRCVEAGGNDPAKCWIFITGYPNHCVIDRIPSPTTVTKFLPDGMTQAVFRSCWCLGDGTSFAAMGFRQFQWDVGLPFDMASPWTDARHPDPVSVGHRDYQSSFVQFAMDRQQKANPADCPENDGDTLHKWGPREYNPAAASWNTLGSGAIFNINAPGTSYLAKSTWVYNYGNPSTGGAINTSGWYLGFRNVTDITINRRMALLDDMNRRIDASYPRVVFADCRNKMSVDTTFSADPTSPYAQPAQDRFVEGVHLNETGTVEWITAPGSVLDQMVARIPVLQRFANLITQVAPDGVSEIPVYLQGMWNGVDVEFAYIGEVTD